MKNIKSSFILLAIVVVGSSFAFTQKSSSIKGGRLNKEKPSIYITFVKTEKKTPLYVNEGEDRIWLRVHNNIRWNISIPSSAANKGYGDFSPFYEIEPIEDGITDIPVGHRAGHFSGTTVLPSGRSMTFSIPKEHLAENLRIRLSFNFEWEDKNDINYDREAKHFVYFFSSNLPSHVK